MATARRIGSLAGFDGVEVDAVEIVARLLVGDRELGALDQLAEGRRGEREFVAEGAGLEVGKTVGREAREVEPRAARGEQHLLAALGLEPDFGAVGELADDLVERVGGNRGGARRSDHRGDALGHLDVEVGGAQVERAVGRLEQHVGEDRVGVAPLDDAMHMAQRFEQMVALERDFHSTRLP